ncbi:MAG: type II toxin-antitoxin system ParD family antitoxin [Magnetococcales bacterium]|nr:type II toxin-antitoxin system ParD family antitoxin [Magnetococcales bacterium]MBF0156051.1 type II toxin-antitoxin system ParD family antitoxin [Magnetococcales bacterium]
MDTNVHLTPELESFARGCVASGRYNNLSEVVRSALRLLQDRESRREQFTAMLLAAQEEADQKGVYTIDQVLSEMDEVIDSTSR